ncbi:MAG: NUDIX hydrolase [Pseudomonadota bacterium]
MIVKINKLYLAYLYLLSGLCLFNSPPCLALDGNVTVTDLPKEVMSYIKDYEHELDKYGNLVIHLTHQNSNTISDLENIRNILHNKWSKRAILLHLPIALGDLGKKVIDNLAFELHDLNKTDNHLVYIYRNGRAVPNISNAAGGAAIFVTRYNSKTHTKEVLVINEYDKNTLTIPGGYSNDKELAIDTAIREAMEEVGIKFSRDQLSLLAVSNSIHLGVNKNYNAFYFTADVVEQTVVKIDNKEVVNYAWVPLKQLTTGEVTKFGKKFLPAYIEPLKSITDDQTTRFISDSSVLYVIPNPAFKSYYSQ